ncbi:hypothetical protein WME79_45875 [Sorangium sp. So ce726]|uniref:hypothetical protein n=1 Tax=Sorangium sp. So ce726 TaxID=3133319 RepID=UPI003F64320A
MPYSLDLPNSCRRHLEAANLLNRPEPRSARPDVAGYLYGIAAECALKEMMRDSGMRQLPPNQRRDDPFYAHFPELKTLLRDCARGRRSGELRKYAEDGQLMQDWDTTMRYAPGKEILPRHVERWREQAERLRQAMETP